MQPQSGAARRAEANDVNADLRAKARADQKARGEASWAAAKSALQRRFDEIATACAGQPEADVHAALLKAVASSSVTPDQGDLRRLARRIANGPRSEE